MGGGGVRSLLLTCIVGRGETRGVIEAAMVLPNRTFDHKEIQLLEAIANQGAIAIDNVSLSQREQRRLRQLEKLQVSSRIIAGELQTEMLLRTIATEAASIFEVDAVSLMTLDDENEQEAIRGSIGLSNQYVQHRRANRIEFNEAANAQYRTPEMVPSQHDLLVSEGIRSVLSVPLVKAGQQLGILNLYGKSRPRPFTEEERDLAQLFSSQAATAFENARLFETLEDRAVELTKLNKLRSEFLARISHELRTPMNSINGYSEMLLMQTVYGKMTEKQVDRVERILRNGRNLLALIDDLLDISKIDAGKMELTIEAVNLREELNNTIYNLESQAATKGLYLKLDAPENLPPVSADSMRLTQIVTNLIGNAVKFTKQGGVTVRVELRESSGEPALWTSIIDTGIGIRPEDQEIIFDEFRQADGSTTREYGGDLSGACMFTKRTENMTGRGEVERQMGQGSKFI